MRSLDRCPVCREGYMMTTGTKQLARGNKRVRTLKCDFCGENGREIIDGPARPRPKRKKRSNLDPLCACVGHVRKS